MGLIACQIAQIALKSKYEKLAWIIIQLKNTVYALLLDGGVQECIIIMDYWINYEL